MKLEVQVCSLELAKKLKELKFEQNSLWWWFEHKLIAQPDYSNCIILEHISHKTFCPKKEWNHYSAFTVAEIFQLLPKGYYVCQKNLWYGDKNIEINHYDNNLNKGLDYLEAGVKMLIWLKEKNL